MRALFGLLVGLVLFCQSMATAGAQEIRLLRDTEIEAILHRMSDPILRSAALDPESVEIILVDSDAINAFVAGGQNIFFHSGLLMAAENPLEVMGVIAHEAGHIAGGHLARTGDAIQSASIQAVLATLLGVAVAVGAGDAEAGAAVITSGQEFARRSFLAYNRGQENAADQAAIRFMNEARLPLTGLLSFFEKLQAQELLPASQQDEYLRTHPLTRDRIVALQAAVERSPYSDVELPPGFEDDFRRMRAKLTGYLKPQLALRTYSARDESVDARYARAIALYRTAEVEEALELLEALIAEEPDNPYFHELKGQILFENSRIDAAIPAYRRAVELEGDSALIRIATAHALLETYDEARQGEAIEHLQVALDEEPRSPRAHRLMATAYGRDGDDARMRLHLAEEAFLLRQLPFARFQANSALQELEQGSPDWFQAMDILNAIRNAEQNER